MADFKNDKRIVLTLDAGGTNLVFSAVQANEEIIEPITLPSQPHDLDKALKTIMEGFQAVKSKLKENPSAISFAFPGPADYRLGIIGDLPNLPAFRGGIALGPMLENHFQIPVFINNDGDLFVYGEAISGFLPYVNQKLKESGSPKQYNVLFGVTLGTGFGAGIVSNGELFNGDNSAAGEIWVMRHKFLKDNHAEEGASIRAVKRVFCEESGINPAECPEPKIIYDIAKGKQEGNQNAALKAFETMGEVVGDALANAITLIDGLIVIGGGLTGAADLFLNRIVDEMNGEFHPVSNAVISRLASKVFNLEDHNQLQSFLKGDKREIKIPFSDKIIQYDPLHRIGVGLSKLSTNKAVSVGAYAYALNHLDK